MKKIYLLFVAAALAACSAEPIATEGIDSLDAAVTGKGKVKAADVEDPMGFYAGNSTNLKGILEVWNDCDNLYVQISPRGDAPEDVEISFENALPVLNNGGQFGNLAVDYSLEDSENLLWTIPVSEFDTENDLFIFVKAWGDYAGSSTFGERKHQYTDFTFDFSMCEDCDESFNYVKNEDGSYTFTYVPAEDMASAELTFTFPQANAQFTVEGWNQNGNGNAQAWKRSMDLMACTTYEWTVTLTRICMGDTNNNNVWADFSVNKISRKNEKTPNITQGCPE